MIWVQRTREDEGLLTSAGSYPYILILSGNKHGFQFVVGLV